MIPGGEKGDCPGNNMLKTTDSGSSNGIQPGLRPPAPDGGGWVAAGPVFVVPCRMLEHCNPKRQRGALLGTEALAGASGYNAAESCALTFSPKRVRQLKTKGKRVARSDAVIHASVISRTVACSAGHLDPLPMQLRHTCDSHKCSTRPIPRMVPTPRSPQRSLCNPQADRRNHCPYGRPSSAQLGNPQR